MKASLNNFQPGLKVPLSGGFSTYVSPEDYEAVMDRSWSARNTGGGKIYAVGSVDGVVVYLHRWLLRDRLTGAALVDHADGDALNNRRSNLRVCTPSENGRNRCKKKYTSSQFKGVSWNKRNSVWESFVSDGKRKIHLGYFKSELAASNAYREAAKRIHGEYARI